MSPQREDTLAALWLVLMVVGLWWLAATVEPGPSSPAILAGEEAR